MDNLLPCPFCGGEAEAHQTYDIDTGDVDGWFVICRNKECTAWPETAEYPTEAEAVAAWNTRAERTCELIPTRGVKYRPHTPTLTCSECGAIYELSEAYPNETLHGFAYCPNCGAKVVGE